MRKSKTFLGDIMRILTWNLNGIRAAIRKGLDDFIERIDADIMLFQEVRALPEQMPKDWKEPEGYEVIWHPAEKKGYSGVMSCSRIGMTEIERGIDTELDEVRDPEGRVLVTKHKNLTCINIYLPNGSSRLDRQNYKDQWLEDLMSWAKKYQDSVEPTLLCGDLNIAHTENDIWDPKGNKNSSGFLLHEREWFTRMLESGWFDLLRNHLGEKKGPYTWWSNFRNARERDRGWRIDYILANQAARKLLVSAEVMREGGLIVSDHAPVIVDLAL